MRLWIDDSREPPADYIWLTSTNQALRTIYYNAEKITHIDLDYRAGEYVQDGGDYIYVLREMERLQQNGTKNFDHITFSIHSYDIMGIKEMCEIIKRNNWRT